MVQVFGEGYCSFGIFNQSLGSQIIDTLLGIIQGKSGTGRCLLHAYAVRRSSKVEDARLFGGKFDAKLFL